MEATAKLRAVLPEHCVVTDEAARYKASMDNLRLSRMPDAVIFPEDEDMVGTVLRLANQFRVPVTARGAGSATTGATTPWQGGWVLDFSRWTRMHIDAVSQMAYVQPGVTVQAIDQAARKEGLMYPPDPGSAKYATIGGTLACNAGGLRGAKYGVTRDHVYALEGFLPTGEFVRWGGDVKKFVSGYNMRDLWIGSEGTLGVITGAVLKLIAAPECRQTFLAGFADEHSALDAVALLLQARLLPSALEFLDRQSVVCTERLWQRSVFPGHEGNALLLIELDGSADAVQTSAQILLDLLRRSALAVMHASSDVQMEQLWQVRRSCSQAMFQLGDSKLNEDVVVPMRSQHALLEATLELRERTGLATPTFGHAADGNFHVHIMYNRDDAAHRAKAQEGIQWLMRRVVELGGAITGEHGVGLAKSPFIQLQHTGAEIRAMRAIKQALDPNNILNPGKIWDPVEVWDHPVERGVVMPWDHRK